VDGARKVTRRAEGAQGAQGHKGAGAQAGEEQRRGHSGGMPLADRMRRLSGIGSSGRIFEMRKGRGGRGGAGGGAEGRERGGGVCGGRERERGARGSGRGGTKGRWGEGRGERLAVREGTGVGAVALPLGQRESPPPQHQPLAPTTPAPRGGQGGEVMGPQPPLVRQLGEGR